MGFGTLLFGYFTMFAFSISPYYFFADIIGSFVAIRALSKLSEYSRYFGWAMYGALGFLVFSSVNAVSLLFGLYPMGEGVIWTIVEILKLASGCVLHVYIFRGILTLAQRAEQEKLVKKGTNRFAATMLYYAAAFIAMLVSPFLSAQMAQTVSAGVLPDTQSPADLRLLREHHSGGRGYVDKAPLADRLSQ